MSWSKLDEIKLLQGAGVCSFEWLCKHVKKSEQAVKNKARRMWNGGVTRGYFSVYQLTNLTGYNSKQLNRARRALKQKWNRTGVKGTHMISEEQIVDLLTWLKNDYWSKKLHLHACVWCGSNQRRHRGLGLCSRCYNRVAKRFNRCGLRIGIKALKSLVAVHFADMDSGVLDRINRSLKKGIIFDELTINRLCTNAGR